MSSETDTKAAILACVKGYYSNAPTKIADDLYKVFLTMKNTTSFPASAYFADGKVK